ncbi:MAG: SPOR domain-containing protein [Sphingobacteriaceae bacterium]|nr:SPOR domain-containing protein [Sphingobacteriaceae bacterium]
MKRLVAIIFLALFSIGNSWAQEPADKETTGTVVNDSVTLPKDTIRYKMDPTVEKQLEKKKELNRSKPPTIDGFRVQIYAGNSRQQAMQIRTEVLGSYSDYAAYLIYKQPTFRVRVGDFKTRFEAQKLLNDLKAQYPSSFIVPDEVLVNPVLAPKSPETSEDADRKDP